MDVATHNATEQERRIIERAVAKLPELVQQFVKEGCVFFLPYVDDVLGSCYGPFVHVCVVNLYPGWRQRVKDGDVVMAEFIVVHEIAHAWCFAVCPDVVDRESQANRQQYEWLPISRHAFDERDILWRTADDLECCACKGGIDRKDKVLSHFDGDEWHFLCTSCWAKVARPDREARQTIEAVLRWRLKPRLKWHYEDLHDLKALGLKPRQEGKRR
jgi:hypothetical protein